MVLAKTDSAVNCVQSALLLFVNVRQFYAVLQSIVMSYVNCGDDGRWSDDSAC